MRFLVLSLLRHNLGGGCDADDWSLSEGFQLFKHDELDRVTVAALGSAPAIQGDRFALVDALCDPTNYHVVVHGQTFLDPALVFVTHCVTRCFSIHREWIAKVGFYHARWRVAASAIQVEVVIRE